MVTRQGRPVTSPVQAGQTALRRPPEQGPGLRRYLAGQLVHLLAVARIGDVIVELGGNRAWLDAGHANAVLLADFHAQAVGEGRNRNDKLDGLIRDNDVINLAFVAPPRVLGILRKCARPSAGGAVTAEPKWQRMW